MANQSAKKRVEDNRKRISLLFYIILGSAGAHILIRLILLRGSATRWTYITALGSLGTQLFLFSSLRSMASMCIEECLMRLMCCLTPSLQHAAPTYSMRGELLDGGVDLKMAGVCEYMQDIIYLLALAQLLGMLTSWAWLLMLVVW